MVLILIIEIKRILTKSTDLSESYNKLINDDTNDESKNTEEEESEG